MPPSTPPPPAQTLTFARVNLLVSISTSTAQELVEISPSSESQGTCNSSCRIQDAKPIPPLPLPFEVCSTLWFIYNESER